MGLSIIYLILLCARGIPAKKTYQTTHKKCESTLSEKGQIQIVLGSTHKKASEHSLQQKQFKTQSKGLHFLCCHSLVKSLKPLSVRTCVTFYYMLCPHFEHTARRAHNPSHMCIPLCAAPHISDADCTAAACRNAPRITCVSGKHILNSPIRPAQHIAERLNLERTTRSIVRVCMFMRN